MPAAAQALPTSTALPFNVGTLDRLMDQSGVDLLLATSKHNVQYLLGGHRSLFFEAMDATGISRYLPVVVYPKGHLDRAAFIGHRLEAHQRETGSFWTPEVQFSSSGSVDAMGKAIEHVRRFGLKPRRIAVELAFLPVDAWMALRDAFPDADIVNAVFVLERLRARKSPSELEKLRVASERVIDAMLSVIANHGPGTTKHELTEALRREETSRGLNFEYLLIAAGPELNRAPSERPWREGDVLSLDSGGNYRGYIGDVARMAILGEPDAELEDALGEIEAVQRAAMTAARPGALGRDIYTAAEDAIRRAKRSNGLHFIAHGMGLISHEAPRLTSAGPVPYPADDADRPLESGMVISVETWIPHERRGFIKLEDTVAVTEAGSEVFADRARGWNRGGTAVAAS